METANTLIELTVQNHPGVMSHITGLFARRAFNLEGILCAPLEQGLSRMYLWVHADGRLEQIVKQLRKLYDVQDVRVRENENGLLNRVHALVV